MRIISGSYKNRRINFNRLQARPTTDFAKESLFNLLNNDYDLNEISVLDLFAGSGNISYEFASRGSKQITAIENNPKCVSFIKTIKLKLAINQLEIILSSVLKYLKKTNNTYDVIFADPPYSYKQEQYNEILNIVSSTNILNRNGTLIIEHSKFITFDNHSWFFVKKKYGSVYFTFFRK